MDQMDRLSKREREVVELLLEGKSNKQIAFSLQITENTVEFHLKNIYSKYEVSSRTELILKLGQSVVADRQDNGNNRDGSDVSNWFISLREAVSKIGREFKMENLSVSDARNATNPMTFYEAILVGFKKYAEFHGRASRAEFWWFMLFIVLATTAFAYISETLAGIFSVATLLPILAAGARRLNDIGMNRWWLLFLLVPVGGLVILGYYWAQPPVNPQPDETFPA